MVSNSRKIILSKISRAQILGKIPEAIPIPSQTKEKKFNLQENKERLIKELGFLCVDVYPEISAQDVQLRIKSLIGGKKILSWDRTELPYGVDVCLDGEQVIFGESPYATQALAEIGLTSCSAAISGTGSLAITGGKGRPRTASLLPYTHVAIVQSQNILGGMEEYFSQIEEETLSYLVFITGPSRTADIELSLTLGVHGPGKVIVVLGP